MTTEHEHDGPHDHEHAHGEKVHDHPHASHEHEHVTHAHVHGDEHHAHEHVHEVNLEDRHDHGSTTSSTQNPGDHGSGAVRRDPGTFEGALSLLRQHGGRITSSRRFLLRVFFEEPGHHTAEELAAAVQAQAPDIHISTIYRNLDELERLGVIVHSHLGHGARRLPLGGNVPWTPRV